MNTVGVPVGAPVGGVGAPVGADVGAGVTGTYVGVPGDMSSATGRDIRSSAFVMAVLTTPNLSIITTLNVGLRADDNAAAAYAAGTAATKLMVLWLRRDVTDTVTDAFWRYAAFWTYLADVVS